ncbi:BrnT family toxin, partial [Candidatus Poribacteria bacterium]
LVSRGTGYLSNDSRPLGKFLRIENGRIDGEHLYNALGRTDSGRYLAVFFIYKRSRHALIVTAREMNAKERRYYGKR